MKKALVLGASGSMGYAIVKRIMWPRDSCGCFCKK